MRQEPSAMKAAKHANDEDRTMACSHTMDEEYFIHAILAMNCSCESCTP